MSETKSTAASAATPDLVLFNGRFTTLDRTRPSATAACGPAS